MTQLKRIGIYCSGSRRPDFFRAHARELRRCKYRDFHFYLLANDISDDYAAELFDLLPNQITIHKFLEPVVSNYMDKIFFAINQQHEFAVKHDEDVFLMAEGWDRLFALAEKMTDKDLCVTGVISNGIPTVELFLENHAPQIKNELYQDFCQTKIGNITQVADYSSLDEDYKEWNGEYFYQKVKNFNHYYKGIHPIRVNYKAVRKINDHIIKNFKAVMQPKNCEVISDDTTKYPYFCNGLKIIKTQEWKKIISDRSLYVDMFDEVPLNQYRQMNKKNLIIDTGVPIIHPVYNWSNSLDYEFETIKQMCEQAKNFYN